MEVDLAHKSWFAHTPDDSFVTEDSAPLKTLKIWQQVKTIHLWGVIRTMLLKLIHETDMNEFPSCLPPGFPLLRFERWSYIILLTSKLKIWCQQPALFVFVVSPYISRVFTHHPQYVRTSDWFETFKGMNDAFQAFQKYICWPRGALHPLCGTYTVVGMVIARQFPPFSPPILLSFYLPLSVLQPSHPASNQRHPNPCLQQLSASVCCSHNALSVKWIPLPASNKISP